MPQQHRTFFSDLPFLVLAGADRKGHHWVTLVEGPDGFVSSPTPKTLHLNTRIDALDPLAETMLRGMDVGVLGIQQSTRRRNRMSGAFAPSDNGYQITVRQSFGNCPQYIRERDLHRVTGNLPAPAMATTTLSNAQINLIRSADTLFIGSGQIGDDDAKSDGYDASHRGGEAGFVQVVDNTHLRIPDYSGNNFFNTIGNLLTNPQIGLVFVDFATGSLLHLSGRADIDWDAPNFNDPSALRTIDITIDRILERQSALSLRWDTVRQKVQRLGLVQKIKESDQITSFYFAPTDGSAPAPFQAGQHLPIELNLDAPHGKVGRSYSLSAAPNGSTYRLSIKREDNGLVSRVMHDRLETGDVIEARAPSGEFKIPDTGPIVLISTGVGLTPMVSMLGQAVMAHQDGPIWFVHGARNGAEHALRDEVDQLIRAHTQAEKLYFYSQPRSADVQGTDYDQKGRITADDVFALRVGPEAHYLLCGPTAFVSGVQSELEAAGVPENRIHFETF